MFKNFKRLLATGVIAGLAMVAPLSAAPAQAATVPEPPPVGASTYPVYVSNGLTGLAADMTHDWDWDGSDGDVITSRTYIANEEMVMDESNFIYPHPEGSYAAITFVSNPGDEWDRSKWRAWSDWAINEGVDGVLMQNITMYQATGNGPDGQVIKAQGGKYSVGVAWVDLLGSVPGNNVMGTAFTYVNVDPGGNFRMVDNPNGTDVVDKTTTTTLTASATQVAPGASVTLTATVKDAQGANLPDGTPVTIAGQAVSLMNGEAKAVVTPSATTSYTASFAGTADHDASESAAVEVLVGVTAPVLPITAAASDWTSVADENGNLAVSGAPAGAAYAYLVQSDAIVKSFGQVTVAADGSVSLDVTGLDAGDYQLVLADGDGNVLGWITSTLVYSGENIGVSPQEATGNIYADVVQSKNGNFQLVGPKDHSYIRPAKLNANKLSYAQGTLAPFQVIDERMVTLNGWDLSFNVTDFRHNSSPSDAQVIRNSALGVKPKLVSSIANAEDATVGVPTVNTVGTTAGSASYAMQFASLAAGMYQTEAVFSADLDFLAPRGALKGTYAATYTLTLTSK